MGILCWFCLPNNKIYGGVISQFSCFCSKLMVGMGGLVGGSALDDEL